MLRAPAMRLFLGKKGHSGSRASQSHSWSLLRLRRAAGPVCRAVTEPQLAVALPTPGSRPRLCHLPREQAGAAQVPPGQYRSC